MQTLFSIQSLRALAAIAVVIFHAGERSGLHFTIGAAGVDVFFVISGFIMMAISESRPEGPLSFLRNRLQRIAPAYWAATLAMIVGALIGLFPNLKLDPLHVLGSFVFIPVQSPNSGNLWPVLVQGWTLNYEIFFYLVFATILLLRPPRRLAALAIVFGALVALGLLLQPQEDGLLNFYTRPLIFEFVAGAFLARLWKNGSLPNAATGLALVCLAFAGFATIQIMKLPFDAWSCGPLAFILVLGAISIETKGKLPAMPALAYLGDASYSIYLWHTFAVSVVVQIGLALGLPPLLLVLAATILGTLTGIVAYECFERPVHLLFRGKRSALWRFPVRRPAR